jgi:glycosyltransferase involved in cell wall biosynthesis
MTEKKHFIVHHRFHDNISCLIDTLQKNGFSVKLFVILKTNTETYDLLTPEITPASAFQKFWKKVVKGRLQSYLPSIRKVYKEYRRSKPEYVIIRPFVSGVGLVHFFFALIYCKKVLLYSQSPKYRKKNFKNDFFLKLVLALPKTEWITPVLYRNEQYFKDKITPVNRINYLQLPHPVVPQKTSWFKGDILNILLIAKAQSYKNHEVLIESLKNLDRNKYLLKIAGNYSNDDAYTSKVLSKLEDCSINYKLLGYVDHSLIGHIYHEADLLVLPSSYETLGYVINEAISYAVPVIVSSEVGARCLVKAEGNGYIFKSKDAKHLEDIFKSILLDRESLKQMSIESEKVFEEELSPEAFSRKYLKIIGETQ